MKNVIDLILRVFTFGHVTVLNPDLNTAEMYFYLILGFALFYFILYYAVSMMIYLLERGF